VQDQHRRLAWILVLGKASARFHVENWLAQYLLMTAEDGVRGVSTSRGYSQLHLLTGHGVERDFLHDSSLPLDATIAAGLR